MSAATINTTTSLVTIQQDLVSKVIPMIATFLREVLAKEIYSAGCNDI